MKTCKRQYFDDQFNLYKKNLAKSWNLIKSAINKCKQTRISSQFNIDGHLTDDKSKIANKFNNFFLSIGKTLCSKIPDMTGTCTQFMQSPNVHSIFLRNSDEPEILNIISNLKNTSNGWDDISCSIMKETAQYFISPLLHTINLSFNKGIVPHEHKIAHVVPIFKNGDLTEVNNYRPISILPFFSKILEKLMYNRLIDFFDKYDILHQNQFGFRTKHSTNIALAYLINKIVTAHDKKDIVLGVFIDLKKAFDTVNHDILIKKLEFYGVRGITLKWIVSYLSERSQYVSFDGCNSAIGGISCGVPQGSILGPLLFLVYVNDLCNVSSIVECLLYADDTSLYVTGSNINEMIQCMNNELERIVQWLNVNKLTLNVQKTEFIVFAPGRKDVETSENVIVNGNMIERVNEIKFLGIFIDHKLQWQKYTQYVKLKVAKNVGILCKGKKIFKRTTLLTIYNSFIQPYISYCLELWGLCAKKYTDSIYKLQKLCCRIIAGVPKRTPSAPLFKSLGILTLSDMYNQSVLMFMFRFYKCMLPSVIESIFSRKTNTGTV